jgi:cytochrome c oxidase subunit 3
MSARLAIWLFLACELIVFGGLISAYAVHRSGSPVSWTPLRDHLGGAGTATMALVASTAMLVFARQVAAAPRALRAGLLSAVLFAIAFCALRLGEWESLVTAGRTPASSTQMTLYFALTAVHLLHVAGGAIALVWLAVTIGRTPAAARPAAAVVTRLNAVTLYWYFVGVVWLAIVVLLYVD